MSASSAFQGANYSVHSKQVTQPRDKSSGYHGVGNMSLNYKVCDVSSTDPAYLAEAINTDHQFGSNFGKGWVSRKFCEFPQMLTLRFDYPVRIKTLQFLSHETMISSRVELFFLPLEAISADEQQRIGHFEFENNISSFESSMQPVRELKTVHFGVSTRQITISMYSPFQHKDNIFQQVGLISLRAIGESIGGQPAPAAPSQQPIHKANKQSLLSMTPIRDIINKRKEEQSQVIQNFPPHFQTLLQQIRQGQSEAAMSDGNTEEVKNKMEKFKLAQQVITKQGNRVVELTRRKQEAINNEDYMMAKEIKNLISQLENQIQAVNGETGELPDEINPKVLILRHQRIFEPHKFAPKSAEQIFEDNQNELDRSAQHLLNSLNRLQEDRRIQGGGDPEQMQNAQPHSVYNDDVGQDLNQAPQQYQQDNDSETLKGYLDQNLPNTDNNLIGQVQPTISQRQAPVNVVAPSKHNEDAVVPAQRMGVKMTFEEQMAIYDQQIQQGIDPSPNMNLMEEIKDGHFDVSGSDYSGPLTSLFQTDLIKQLVSLKWQDRFSGLKTVTSSLSDYSQNEKFSEVINHLLQLFFDEKNTQICLQTILLINLILTSLPEFVFYSVDKAIAFICDKGVESRIQLASTTSYELFCRHKSADLHDAVGLLATQQSFSNKVTLNSHKQIMHRLTLIHRATVDFDTIISERMADASPPEYPLYEIQEMLKHSLQHPDREIRSISQLILQLVYDKHGFVAVEAISMQLHPQILQVIKPKIPEVDKVIVYLQKSKKVNHTSVYGSSGANNWPITLKSRMNKALLQQQQLSGGAQYSSKQGSSRSLNYGGGAKLKISVKGPPSSTSVSSIGQQLKNLETSNVGDGDQQNADSTTEADSISKPNNDLALLLGSIDNSNNLAEQQSRESKETEGDGTCQFCGIVSIEFANADKMDLHYVLQCQMLTNCAGCTQIIEVNTYTDHKLNQCAKKADFSQCPRCLMAIEADFFEQHITQLKCTPFDSQMVRCPLCKTDLPIEESEEKTWNQHLAIEKCPGANVRISTNAKARVSILRAKQPPASEVIMEEDDEEDDVDTVGGKTPARADGGRNTEMSKKFEQEQEQLSNIDETHQELVDER